MTYVFFVREIKQWIGSRTKILKWQQIVGFLDKQSDGIIALKKKCEQEDENQTALDSRTLFENKKFRSLFNLSLINDDPARADEITSQKRFIKLKNEVE